MRWVAGWLTGWLAGVGTAFAEEPGTPPEPAPTVEPGGSSFDLNSVLVATFEAQQSFLEPETERVRGLVEVALGRQYVVLPVSDVPAFEDYTAEVYLRSCPDGQYLGCVFVVGGRALTDWVIGGQVAAVEGGYRVTLSFIDVSEGKLKIDTVVDLDGSNDAAFQDGVLKIMDALVRGEVKQLDTRSGPSGDPEAEARAAREKEARERTQKQFAVDSTFEDAEDAGVEAEGEARGEEDQPARMTAEELDRLEAKGGVPPWERAGLTRSQYKLYRNSGQKLEDFKDRLLGRRGQILIKASGNIASGPWGQYHETWYLQAQDADPSNLRQKDVLDDLAVQIQTRSLAPGGQLELAVGIAPWAEISVFGGIRSAPYGYRFYRQVEGTPSEPPAVTNRAVTSWLAGARIGFIPFPAFPVRPTLHVGGSYWSGNALQKVVAVPSVLTASQMRPNNLILVNVNPGAEVSLGKWVLLFTRFDLDIPVLGRSSQRFNIEANAPELDEKPELTTDLSFSLGASLGVAARIPVGPKRR